MSSGQEDDNTPQDGREGAVRAGALRRKLVPRRRAEATVQAPRAQPVERALARAITGACGLHARATAQPARAVGLSELLDMIEPGGFLATLRGDGQAAGAGDAPAGLVCLDQALFVALVEQIATGRLSAAAAQSRPPTPTDAALLSEVIDTLLAFRAEEAARPSEGGRTDPGQGEGDADPGLLMAPWRFDRFVPGVRLLEVLLEEARYTVQQVAVRLSAGERERDGVLILALPMVEARPVAGAGADAATQAPAAAGAEEWQERFTTTVMQAPAELRAILSRVAMPLGEALALAPGTVLTLPLSVLEEVRVEARDTRLLCHARLGQHRGMRALRVTTLADGVHPTPDDDRQHGAAAAVAFQPDSARAR